MKENRKLGGILALISGLMGIIGHTAIFLGWYVRGMSAEAAEPGCEILLKYIHPAMSDLGMLGGVLFLVRAYGFFTKKNWAFLLSVIAIVLSLQGAWFINVPFMAAGLPPIYFTIFWPFLVVGEPQRSAATGRAGSGRSPGEKGDDIQALVGFFFRTEERLSLP